MDGSSEEKTTALLQQIRSDLQNEAPEEPNSQQ